MLFNLNTKAVLATSSAKSKIDVRADTSPPEIDVVFSKLYFDNTPICNILQFFMAAKMIIVKKKIYRPTSLVLPSR